MRNSNKYMKLVSSFVGIEDYGIIRAEGTNILDKDMVLKKARNDADGAAERFVKDSLVTV